MKAVYPHQVPLVGALCLAESRLVVVAERDRRGGLDGVACEVVHGGKC